jgi:hypothetical protein
VGVCFITSNRLKLLFLHLFGFGKLFALSTNYIQAMKNILLSHWKRNYVYGEKNLMCVFIFIFLNFNFNYYYYYYYLFIYFYFLLIEEGEEFDVGYASFEQNMSGLC